MIKMIIKYKYEIRFFLKKYILFSVCVCVCVYTHIQACEYIYRQVETMGDTLKIQYSTTIFF